MRRGRVEVVVTLLDVLAVIAFRTGKSEQPLFQDRVVAVPQRKTETQAAFAVGDAEQTVLSPAIRARTRLVVRKVIPGRAAFGVVFAHRSPLPLGQVRSPALPVARSGGVFVEPQRLRIRRGARGQ